VRILLCITLIWLYLYLVPSTPPRDVGVVVINSTAVFVDWRPPIVTDQNGMIKFYVVSVVDLQQTNITNVTIFGDTRATINGNMHPYPIVCSIVMAGIVFLSFTTIHV